MDSFNVELLKADIETFVDVLLDLLSTIWDTETVLDDWSKGLKRNNPYCCGCKGYGKGDDNENIQLNRFHVEKRACWLQKRMEYS